MLPENGKWHMEILHGKAHEILHSFNEPVRMAMNNVGEICQKDICACFDTAPSRCGRGQVPTLMICILEIN